MSFSLYGDLPKPKSAKNETGKGPEGSNDVAKAWAAVAPPTTTAPATQEPIALTNSTDSSRPSGIHSPYYLEKHSSATAHIRILRLFS